MRPICASLRLASPVAGRGAAGRQAGARHLTVEARAARGAAWAKAVPYPRHPGIFFVADND
ncbi:protein of unknown function [Paraburkholderia kururiensis]